jgi:hypothetical protein
VEGFGSKSEGTREGRGKGGKAETERGDRGMKALGVNTILPNMYSACTATARELKSEAQHSTLLVLLIKV